MGRVHGAQGAGAVDVRDGKAFAWQRWLENITEYRSVRRVDLERVLIVRRHPGDSYPSMLCCHNDDTSVSISPDHSRERRLPVTRGSGWKSDPLLSGAAAVHDSWMRS